jgi:septum formation inhibitor-activating ATPase MinD
LCIAFTSYSGGTGKTTLAVDTALHFARRTKLPVMLMEFTYGLSALDMLTGQEMPHLFDLTTQLDIEAMRWKGVSLVPMDYENCQDLSMRLINNYVKKQMAHHVLTVIDSQWPHGLIGAVKDEVDQWLVVGAPRLVAVENAEKLRAELNPHASVIVNQNGSPFDSLALAGRERALTLPRVRHPDRFDGELGKRVLEWLYGKTWKQYEKGFWNQLRERALCLII